MVNRSKMGKAAAVVLILLIIAITFTGCEVQIKKDPNKKPRTSIAKLQEQYELFHRDLTTFRRRELLASLSETARITYGEDEDWMDFVLVNTPGEAQFVVFNSGSPVIAENDKGEVVLKDFPDENMFLLKESKKVLRSTKVNTDTEISLASRSDIVFSTTDIMGSDGGILINAASEGRWRTWYQIVRTIHKYVFHPGYGFFAERDEWDLLGMILSSLLVLVLFLPLRYVYDNGIDGYDCNLRILLALIAGAVSGVTLSLYASMHLTWFMRPVSIFLLRTRLPAVGFWFIVAGCVFVLSSFFLSDRPLYTGFVSFLALVTGYASGSLLLFAITSSIIMAILYFCLRWILPLLFGIFGGIVDVIDSADSIPTSSNTGGITVNQSKTETEVWRMNGMMRENLRVSSDGERYYDPDDGEWHRIKK